MKEQKLVPKSRFKEFQNADAWEQREVKEMLRGTPGSIKIGPFGSALKKECFVDNGVKVYAQENTFLRDFNVGNYYITEAKYRELQTCELFPGDLVISMMGTVGACAVFPDTAERGIMNSHLLRLQFNKNIIPEYIMFLLRDSLLIRKQINKLSVGSIMSGLSSSVVKKLVFTIPSIEEQDKLVCYFQKSDHLITLEQRKLDKTKALKSAYLAEMFPAEGERVPKRRFKKYVNEWQTMNFEQILIVNSGRDYKHLNKGSIPVYGTGGFMLLVDDKLSDVDAIGIGRKGTIDRPQLLKAPFWTVDTLFFLTPIKNMDLYFLYIKSQTINWRKMDESTGVPSLSKTTIEKISVSIPCLNEQQAIGNFFKKLDESINNQQQKLNKLKATKQAYLEEMFV